MAVEDLNLEGMVGNSNLAGEMPHGVDSFITLNIEVKMLALGGGINPRGISKECKHGELERGLSGLGQALH
jgi:hypothetical protein